VTKHAHPASVKQMRISAADAAKPPSHSHMHWHKEDTPHSSAQRFDC